MLPNLIVRDIQTFKLPRLEGAPHTGFLIYISLRKKCPYSEFFWSVFSRIWAEYGEIRSVSPYSVRMWENADQNNSKYGHFSGSVSHDKRCFFVQFTSIITIFRVSFFVLWFCLFLFPFFFFLIFYVKWNDFINLVEISVNMGVNMG